MIRGAVFDVAVDLRKNSPSFGKWYGIVLTEENKKQFLIPRGFAHGFLVLSEEAEFCYKCDDFYHPDDEADWPGMILELALPGRRSWGSIPVPLLPRGMPWRMELR